MHYVLMCAMTALILFSAGFAYLGANGYLQERAPQPDDLVATGGVGQEKPLPDYIVDKMPADELEMLKP
ncbi:MAG: hypothetical protein ACLFP8_08075 [Alphaproteobacteria bacterium]